MDKKFLTEDDYNKVLDYLEEQQKLFDKNEDTIEILNAKYFSVLFQVIYHGVFSNDKEAVDNIICALTTDDVTVMKDKTVVEIKSAEETYTVDIPRKLGLDMFDVGTSDIYSRNRHGIFRVKTIARSDRSVFKTPVKKNGTAKENTPSKYLYNNSRKIFERVLGEDVRIAFKSLYFSGIFNRVKEQGIELTHDELMSEEGRKILDKECKRVRAGNPYNLILWFFPKAG